MFHLADGAAMYSHLLAGGSHVIVRASPRGVAARDRDVKRDRHAAGADDDPDVRRSSGASTNYDLSSLQRIVYGASPISEAVLGRAMAKLPQRRVRRRPTA